MIKLAKPIYTLLLFLLCTSIMAQNYYTIQIGTFRNTTIDDFKSIASYGYVFADIQLNNSKQIHLGGFTSKKMADRALVKVKQKGFKDAFVKTYPFAEGREVSVVQLSTQSLGQKIKWARYLNMGRVHTIFDGTKVKITTGVFSDANAAQERLSEARTRGFDDAFIKRVNSQILHEVNVFETRGLEPMAKVKIIDTPPVSTSQNYNTKGYTPKGGSPSAPQPYSYPNSSSTPQSYSYSSPSSAPTSYAPQKSKSYMPAIKYTRKKNAVKWLQELLQQTGTYRGKITSQYNSETASAFAAAKTKNYQLARFANQNAGQVYGDFRDWEDIQLLLGIANGLTPYGERSSNESIKEMYGKPIRLDLNELQLITSWDYRFRRGLKVWANSDRLRGEMARAVKIAYLQSQLRLETYYRKQGYNTDQSKGLALTTLKVLVGNQLELFQ